MLAISQKFFRFLPRVLQIMYYKMTDQCTRSAFSKILCVISGIIKTVHEKGWVYLLSEAHERAIEPRYNAARILARSTRES